MPGYKYGQQKPSGMTENAPLPLIAYQVATLPITLRRAPRERDWMRGGMEFSRRCLPILLANQSGWELALAPDVTIRVLWDGGAGLEATTILQRGDGGFPAQSHFGDGIVTFSVPFLFRTPPGWNLLVRGPANQPVDGRAALEGLVETDKSDATFTVNWKMTRPGLHFFRGGEPLALLVPQRRGELEQFQPSLLPIEADAAQIACYEAWVESRRAFNADLISGQADGWQKDYMREAAQTKRDLKPFLEDT